MDNREQAGAGSVGLIDVNAETLRDLWAMESSSALDEALGRVVEPAGQESRAAVSAFNSRI
jgi:hypothetical protein